MNSWICQEAFRQLCVWWLLTSILLLVVFYKTYKTTLQQLFLCLTITTVIQEAWTMIGFATQFECSGSMTMVIAQWMYLLSFGIIVFLAYKIYEQFRRDPFPKLSRSKCCRVAAECVFDFIVLVPSFIYMWTFFSFFGQWCSKMPGTIELDGNCTASVINFSSVLLIATTFNYWVLIGMLTITVLSAVFCCLSSKYKEVRITLYRTLMLLGYFIIALVLNLGIYSSSTAWNYKLQSYVWWMVYAAILPVLQLIFPLGFLHVLPLFL